jgi:hypothetical protein
MGQNAARDLERQWCVNLTAVTGEMSRWCIHGSRRFIAHRIVRTSQDCGSYTAGGRSRASWEPRVGEGAWGRSDQSMMRVRHRPLLVIGAAQGRSHWSARWMALRRGDHTEVLIRPAAHRTAQSRCPVRRICRATKADERRGDASARAQTFHAAVSMDEGLFRRRLHNTMKISVLAGYSISGNGVREVSARKILARCDDFVNQPLTTFEGLAYTTATERGAAETFRVWQVPRL